MKCRETESGKLKVVMTKEEANVIASVLQYARLGINKNTDVVYELISFLDRYVDSNVPVGFSYNEDEKFTVEIGV